MLVGNVIEAATHQLSMKTGRTPCRRPSFCTNTLPSNVGLKKQEIMKESERFACADFYALERSLSGSFW